jgi:Raf kinase inhibitor-like YbhB/YbcL family protein
MRITRFSATLAIAVTLGVGVMGAQDKGKAKGKGPNIPPPIKLTITGFNDGQEIPQKYTCAVPSAVSPAMSWTDVPAGTATFAMIFHDPDPVLGKGTGDVLHWAIFNIPGTARSLPEGVATKAELEDGTRQPNNLGGNPGYMGPCPPPPAPHHYTFEFYALDTKLDIPATSSRDDLLKAMNGHVLAKAVYIGMFHR